MAERRPRVLLACDFFLRYASMLAGGLQGAGAEVALLTRDHDQEFGDVEGAAAEFAAAASPGTTRFVVPGRVRSPRGVLAAVGVRRSVRRFAPEVVHLQASIGNDPRLVFAAGARPRRFALTIHDPVSHPGEEVARSAIVGNKALLRSAGLIFVHATSLRDELQAEARPRAPIVVVPHGVDTAAPEPLPRQPAILFFGRLGHYKGVDVLLEAMGEVWKAVPEATLTVAGNGELEDHPALADARVAVRTEHIPDAELPDLFAASRCVALPYRQASQSGVGSLAKSHARPLVVSDAGGLPELVADGSGLVVPSEDPVALAGSLVSILEDDALAARLGEAGRRTAEGGADWRTVGEATLRAYEEHLLAPKPGS